MKNRQIIKFCLGATHQCRLLCQIWPEVLGHGRVEVLAINMCLADFYDLLKVQKP